MSFKNQQFIFISIIILGLISIGGYLGYFYLNNTPEKVFLKSVNKFLHIKSFSFDGNLSLSFNPKDLAKGTTSQDVFGPLGSQLNLPLKERVNLNFDFKGDIERESTSTLKSQGYFSFSSDFLPFEFKLEYVALPDSLYFRQKNLDFFLAFFFSPEFTKKYLSDWIKIDYKKIKELQKINPSFKNVDKYLKDEASTYDALNYLDKISNIIMRSKVLVVKDEGKEFLGNVQTRKFSVTLDKEKILPTIKEINEILPQEAKLKENELKQIEEEIKKIEKMPIIYFYVNPSNKLIYRISYFEEIKTENLKYPVSLNFKVDINNHNKKFDIKAPQSYIELEKILEEMSKNILNKMYFKTPTSSLPLDNSLPLATSSPLFEF
jgi:hypothetical protein